jgi:iron complex transport system ATP-binding protein
MQHVIQLSKVSYIRDERVILDDVDWTVDDGEHWIVFGPNGSGKTTLLRMINGYIWPTTGTVEVLGERFGDTDIPALRKSIGWVSRSLENLIHDDDPVIEIVKAGSFAGTVLWQDVDSQVEERARSFIDQLGITANLEQSYGSLSQGEQTKVLIARALMLDPRLLVLDEPCEGLDIASREEFLKDLPRLAAIDGLTVIMVTHHVEEIRLPFFKILVLKAGTVFARGSIETVITSEILSELFNMNIEVEQVAGRYHSKVD